MANSKVFPTNIFAKGACRQYISVYHKIFENKAWKEMYATWLFLREKILYVWSQRYNYKPKSLASYCSLRILKSLFAFYTNYILIISSSLFPSSTMECLTIKCFAIFQKSRNMKIKSAACSYDPKQDFRRTSPFW